MSHRASRGTTLPRMSPTQLTPETHARLVDELRDLTTRGRIEIAKQIEAARALGDLSENGDYHAAKDAQGKMEARIRQLQATLDGVIVVDQPPSTNGVVETGRIVAICYEGDDEPEQYFVGSIEEKRDDATVLSPGSPLGKALIGKCVGDSVEYEAPNGLLRVQIVSVD